MAELIKVQSRISPEAFELLSNATTRKMQGKLINELILRFVTEDGQIRDCSDGVLEQMKSEFNARFDELKATLDG